MRRILILVALLVAAASANAESPSFKDVIRKTEARVEPRKVKRGQAVTWSFSVEVLDGWHTYPTKQTDPNAEPYQNKFKFPTDANVVFVGNLAEPLTVQKDEDGTKVAMVEKFGVWKRTLVVRPDAKPGTVKVPVKITMLACADRCLPPQTITAEVEITITDDPPVAVDAKYRAEVEAAKK